LVVDICIRGGGSGMCLYLANILIKMTLHMVNSLFKGTPHSRNIIIHLHQRDRWFDSNMLDAFRGNSKNDIYE